MRVAGDVLVDGGQCLGGLLPGKKLDADVRKSTERGARKASADLKATLAAPTREELTQHWIGLGGSLAD